MKKRTYENMGDLISRQAAIDAVEESRRLNHHQDGKEACAHEYEHRHFLKILMELPSVQSELSMEIQEILNYLDTTLHPIISPEHWDVYSELHDMISALPSVQPEPKTGKWIKVYGFATPGGDPVWRCSECGKGLHVYGIEASTYGADIAEHQWVSCPNCGADMREERDG